MVLFARAYGDDHAARGGLWAQRRQGHVHDAVVLLLHPLRPGPPPGERLFPSEIPARPAADNAAREPLRLLSALPLGNAAQSLLDGLLDRAHEPRAVADQGGPRAQRV